MRTAVRFEQCGYQYRISFRYDPALIDLIKSLPSYARSWDPTHRVWLVDEDYAEMLADDLTAYGYTVLGLQQRAQQCHADDASDWARVLFRRVGPARHGPVFRSLCKVLHPDVATGDTALMRELLEAHTELTDDRKESA